MPYSHTQSLQQSLSRAIDLEDDHIGRFRTWALRLRPFDMSLARILDLQADEMGDHKRMLLECTKARINHFRNHPTSIAHRGPATAEHFFVLNATGATTILEKARALKEEARNFYLQCMLTEADSSRLIKAYQALQRFKDCHIQILLEAQAGFASKHHRISNVTHQRFPEASCQPDRECPDGSLSC